MPPLDDASARPTRFSRQPGVRESSSRNKSSIAVRRMVVARSSSSSFNRCATAERTRELRRGELGVLLHDDARGRADLAGARGRRASTEPGDRAERDDRHAHSFCGILEGLRIRRLVLHGSELDLYRELRRLGNVRRGAAVFAERESEALRRARFSPPHVRARVRRKRHVASRPSVPPSPSRTTRSPLRPSARRCPPSGSMNHERKKPIGIPSGASRPPRRTR